jgi:hypothetical protein
MPNKRELLKWIDTHLALLFGSEADSKCAVRVERRGSILLVDLHSTQTVRRFVVKALPPSPVRGKSVYDFHARLLNANPALSAVTPHFLNLANGSPWVVMEYLPGESLLESLVTQAGRGPEGIAWGCAACRRAGEILAQFHSVSAQQVGLPTGTRPMQSFIEAGQRLIHKFRHLLRIAGMDNRSLNWLSDSWSRIQGNRLGTAVLPVDAQLKNVLVTDGDRLCFIDLAYEAGHEAMGAGVFLASIDRMRVRRPWIPYRIIAAWRDAFVEGYLPHVPQYVRDELSFFYPWALLVYAEDHVRRRPLAGHWASLVYAWQLARCVKSASARGQFFPVPTPRFEWSCETLPTAAQQIDSNR